MIHRFFIFLLKNNIFKFVEELKRPKSLYYSLTKFSRYLDVLEILEKKDPFYNVNAKIYIDNYNWFDFLYNDNEKVKSYYLNKCLPDKKSNSELQAQLLHRACSFGDIFTVERLLQRKFVDVNSKTFKKGKTPLIIASQNNFFKIVYALINDERVDVNSFSNDHETSLYLAVECNYIETVDFLLNDKKVDVNIPACERGYDKIVRRMFLRSDLDLNAMCKDCSPFGLAVENWQIKIVKLLMNERRIKFENENEKNPLQRACYNR